MLRIRLRRMGPRSRPTYRAVVIDSRKARDGEYLEALGHYDPRTKSLELKLDRARYWLARGAQPSETAAALIRRAERASSSTPEQPVPTTETATSAEQTTTDITGTDTETTEGDRHEGTD